jgi:hypothetical protein
MDATKIATGPTPDPDLDVPAGAVFVDLGCGLELYPSIAREAAQALKVQSGVMV